MERKKSKLYKAIFRDKNKNWLWTQEIIAYNYQQARDHAINILAGSMQYDARSVIVKRLY